MKRLWHRCCPIITNCYRPNVRDGVPSCQIPWAIFQQICVKWNHTGLPEDVQNQQRSQRMRMIHIVMLNIIHNDTDDNNVSECAGFQSCLPGLSNVYTTIQSTLPSLLGHIVGRIIWHGFPLYRIHTNALTGVAISPQALIWHFDMSHKILLFICSHLLNHLYVTSHNDHTAKDLSLESCS